MEEWYKAKKRKKFWKIFFIVIAALAVLAVALYFLWPKIASEVLNSPWEPFEVDEETLESLAPVDKEASKAIAAMPEIGKDETWAVYVYMIGSNLESNGLDETSGFINILIDDEANSLSAQESDNLKTMIRTFAQEITDQGCELPNVLFTPYVRTQDSQMEDVGGEDIPGAGSTDLATMMVENFPENTTLIVQTGGSKRWENSQVNPNRSQRFTVDSQGLHEVYNGRTVNMGSPFTLADFLDFCVTRYPADHKVLIFWDHGGGASGYGSDELYGNSGMSLADITSALSVVAEKDSNNPLFDIIGFDACLMGCAETCHALYGYGKYLLASEELEPCDGWDYEGIMTKLGENPYMNPAMLGKVVTDSYIESTLASLAEYGYIQPATFSVIDINGGEAAYNAWTVFCSSALKLAGEDPTNLAKLSQAANASTAMGQNLYRVYNMIDLGMFMNEAMELLPNESAAVLRAMERAVVYKRSCSYLMDCTGLSVYFPARIEGEGGIANMLSVMESGIDNDYARALFYYKVAGCLNETLSKSVRGEVGELPKIDYSIMNSIPLNKVECDGNGNMLLTLTDEQFKLTQDTSFQIVSHDPETEDLVYYGEDAYSMINDNGTISTSYSGKWIYLGDIPLPLEIVSKTGDDVTFRTPINYNGIFAWLLTGYNAETDEVSILGVREDELYAGNAGRNMLTLKKGDYIGVLYETGNLYTNASGTEEKSLVFGNNTILEEKSLSDGHYYEIINVYDIRSDSYYSAVAGFDMKDGVISNQAVDEEIFSYDKD